LKDADRTRLVGALRFALEAHSGQTRKGTCIPYASHLLAVAGLVLELGGDGEQTAAALLHDVLEDCPGVDRAAIESRFGAEIARIVHMCSDLLEGDTPERKSQWLPRKRHYIDRLRTADARARLVAACDKLHNLRALIADLQREGTDTLRRFNATPEQTRWYYHEVRGALGADLPERLLGEIDALLEQLRAFLPEASRQA